MWFLDFPEHDPDSNYPEPTQEQLAAADEAARNLERLKASLEPLTVPQQRAIIAKLSGSVFKDVPPAGDAESQSRH